MNNRRNQEKNDRLGLEPLHYDLELKFDGLRETDRRIDNHFYVEGTVKIEILAQISACQIFLDLGATKNINISRNPFKFILSFSDNFI